MSQPPTINPHDATKNNFRLFQMYEKKLLQPNIQEYANIAEKLSLWLSDAKAYYLEARSFIIRLLFVAQLTLRRCVGYNPDLRQHFHASEYLIHPMTFYYVKLVKSIQPFLDLFVEPDLQRGAIALLQSVQNIQLAPPPPATPAVPQRPPVAGLLTNQDPRTSYAPQSRQQTSPISVSSSSSIQEIPPVTQRDTIIKRSTTSCSDQQEKPPFVHPESTMLASQPNVKNTSVGELEKGAGSKTAPEVERGSDGQSLSLTPEKQRESPPTPLVAGQDRRCIQAQSQPQILTSESPNQPMLPIETKPATEREVPQVQVANIEPQSRNVELIELRESTTAAHIPHESGTPIKRVNHQLHTPNVPFGMRSHSLREDVDMQDGTCDRAENAMQIYAKLTNISAQKPPEQKHDLVGRLSHPQESPGLSSSAFPSMQQTVVPLPTPPLTAQPVPSMNARQGLPQTFLIPEESTLGQLFTWYDGRKMRGKHVSKAQDVHPRKDAIIERKSVQDQLAEDNAVLDQMTKDGSSDSKFYQEVHVVGITKGVATSSFIEFSFSLSESEVQQLKIWVNKAGHLTELRSAICMSLGCYSSNELFQFLQVNRTQDLSEAIKKGVACLPCGWPQTGSISMNVNVNGVRKDLPLSPPLVTTKEGLVDVSEFLVAGRNVIRIHQSNNCEQYTFVLHAHRPTVKQLRDVLVVREQDVKWQDWLSDVARPIEMDQSFKT